MSWVDSQIRLLLMLLLQVVILVVCSVVLFSLAHSLQRRRLVHGRAGRVCAPIAV